MQRQVRKTWKKRKKKKHWNKLALGIFYKFNTNKSDLCLQNKNLFLMMLMKREERIWLNYRIHKSPTAYKGCPMAYTL